MFLEGHLSFLTKPNLLDSENYSGSGCQFFKLVWGQLQFVQKKKLGSNFRMVQLVVVVPHINNYRAMIELSEKHICYFLFLWDKMALASLWCLSSHMFLVNSRLCLWQTPNSIGWHNEKSIIQKISHNIWSDRLGVFSILRSFMIRFLKLGLQE